MDFSYALSLFRYERLLKGAVADFKPFVRYSEFGDSDISFSIILRAQEFVGQYELAKLVLSSRIVF